MRDDVPYLVNNTGRPSESAAALVLAACAEMGSARPERLVVFELGAGSGLHARYFLDAFRAQCRSEGRDDYERLVYVVSDRFERTTARWQEDGMFADHAGHVLPALVDARNPTALRRLTGETETLPAPPLVVFCNYLLDVLPSIIARRAKTRFERLCVRTHLAGSTALNAAGLPSLDEARALAASGRAQDLDRLLPLLPHLGLETDYRPWTPEPGAEQLLAEALPEGECSIVNAEALGCLERLLEIVDPVGFVRLFGPMALVSLASPARMIRRRARRRCRSDIRRSRLRHQPRSSDRCAEGFEAGVSSG